MKKNPCSQCQGSRCPYCLHTGKELLEIGELVVWENMDHWNAPEGQKETLKKYLGKPLRVNGILPCPNPQEEGEPSFYYVGVDVGEGEYVGLIFDTNVRRATAAETVLFLEAERGKRASA